MKSWTTWIGLALLIAGGVVIVLVLQPYISSALTVIPSAPALTTASTVGLPSTPVDMGAGDGPENEAEAAAESATPTSAVSTPVPAPDSDGDAAAPLRPTATPVPTGEMPVQVRIKTIKLDAPVKTIGWIYTESGGQRVPVWDVPDERAAGWHKTSAPVGLAGNTVLNGHNTNNGEVFRDLYKLDIGADIDVQGESRMWYRYRVTEKYILPEAGQPLEVRQKNAEYIQPTTDERLTLVTCHPYGSLRNRLIVIALPVDRVDQASGLDEQRGE